MFCFYMDVKMALASIISNQEVKLTYTHTTKTKTNKTHAVSKAWL